MTPRLRGNDSAIPPMVMCPTIPTLAPHNHAVADPRGARPFPT